MRAAFVGVCVAVALTAGGAAYLGGSAAVATHTSLTRIPLQFAQTQRGDGYRGVGASVAFDRTGVSLGPLRQRFVGASARPVPSRPTGTRVSYFHGPKKAWRTGLSGYSRLTYRGLWPGIDLAFDGTLSRLKYTFTLAPGADPGRIGLAWSTAPRLLADGTLQIGGARDDAPVAWQTVGGKRVPVAAAYTLAGRTVGFRLGAYDRSRPLTLDPSLVYAGFIGGTDYDEVTGIAVDSSGAAYVAGITQSDTSEGFPATGPDAVFGGNGFDDGFLAKVKADGSGFDYVTYIGGTDVDQAKGVAVDSSGRAYVVGRTYTADGSFPVLGGPDTTPGGSGNADGFLTVVNPLGTGLVYSTFIGTDQFEEATAVAVDAAGNAYVTGTTSSPTFPNGLSGNTFDSTLGGGLDAFVVKVHAGGTAYDYAGFIGGDDEEWGNAIALDSSNDALVTGYTRTTDASFEPVNGPYSATFGGQDAFVAKINPAGTGFLYKGFLGGNGSDEGRGIAVDPAGNAYVTGITFSPNWPHTVGPNGAFVPGFNGFAVKLDPLSNILYSGYLPGTIGGYGIAVDSGGSAYVAGETSGPAGFPAGGGPDSSFNGGTDAYVMQLRPDPSLPPAYATFIGGASNDFATGIAIDSTGAAYAAGNTYWSPTQLLPTTPAGPSPAFHGTNNREGFVEKIGPSAFPPPSSNADLSNLTISAGTLSPPFSSGVTSYNAGSTSTANVTVTPTSAESHATIRVRLNGGGFVLVPSGTPSPSLPLVNGANTIDVQVTAQDGLTIKTYSIAITRVSGNANLNNLTISVGTLTPAFLSGTTSYTDSVPNATTSVTVTPTTANNNATVQVRVNGGAFSPVTSGSPSGPLALNPGLNPIDVKVTAQDPAVTKIYSIAVTRLGPPCGAVVTTDCQSVGTTFAKLTVNGGNVTLTNVTIGKLFTSNAKSLHFSNVHVTGATTIQFTKNASEICGSTFDGALTISSNAGALTIGDPAASCPGNTIKSLIDNASLGNVRVLSNSVGTTITLNGNKNIDVESNTAGKSLGCLLNKTVTGFGNTVPKKTGQCAGL